MAKDIATLPPDRRGQRIAIAESAPREAAVIANALNRHLEESDAFIERELTFARTTSHELRTPVAVIASTAEVALDNQQSQQSIESCLQKILQAARGMEDLVAMLSALARDPARLRASSESIDLAELIPSIVQDHSFLAEHKSLTFSLQLTPPLSVTAPKQIVRTAIGNLIRNAIENSDSGVIRISINERSQLVIKDPGHGMTEEQLSQLYTSLARSGVASSKGIGLDLIQRICIHFGWTLQISSERGHGTTATLSFAMDAERHRLT